MLGISNEKIGAAAGVAAMEKLKADPELVNQIVSTAVTALVEAAIKNLPALIAGIQQAIAQSKQPKPAA